MKKSNSIVSVLRSTSDHLKANKEVLAATAVKTTTGTALDVLEVYSASAAILMSMVSTALSTVKAIKNNPKLLEQAETLIQHIIGDVGSRLNELANLCEAVSKDPKLSAIMDDTKAQFAKLIKLVEKKS